MRARAIAAVGICVFGSTVGREVCADALEREVTETITRFERAVQVRNVTAVAEVVADDIVVFENGHRNDGWLDFRDNHLIPEMKEAAPPMSSRLVKVVATPAMAWGYSRTDLFAGPKRQKPSHLLWSVYVLEKRESGWKITVLDWSMAKLKAG